MSTRYTENVSPVLQLPPSLHDVLAVGMEAASLRSPRSPSSSPRLTSQSQSQSQSPPPPQTTKRQSPDFSSEESRKASKPTEIAFDPKRTKFQLDLKLPVKWNFPATNYTAMREHEPYGNLPIIDDKKYPHTQFSIQAMELYDKIQPTKFVGTLDEVAQQLAFYTVSGKTILNLPLFKTVLDTLTDIVFDSVAFLGADENAVREYLPNLEASIRDRLDESNDEEKVQSILYRLKNNNGEITMETLSFVLNAISSNSGENDIEGLIEELVDMEIDEEQIFALWFQIDSILKTLQDYNDWPSDVESEVKNYLDTVADMMNFKIKIPPVYSNQMADPQIREYLFEMEEREREERNQGRGDA